MRATHRWGILWLAALLLAPPAGPAATPEEALSALEAQLAGDPDNLRLGSEYRQRAIQANAYDRAIAFLEKLVADHPNLPNAQLNFGFAYVDKIPVAGSITQVILANNALAAFTKAIELKRSWLALYTRGNSYLYWPVIFGRAPLGVADLEAAMNLQKAESKKPYHVRSYIALGDGYWKMDDLARARQVWAEGLQLFPENAALQARMQAEGEALKAVIDETYDITKRVDTSLQELWAEENTTARAGK
ncbi:MAG TPA: tetratricopeptide repeat protein [Methylomirabilota bacterium]|nr:tetratricopeptide repeat protein [Methylomirabilota bacterium]